MCGSLRVNIFDGKAALVFMDESCWYLPLADFAKKAVLL